jgi:hypothetical protein
MAIDMSALYVQLHPDCELAEGEQYSVNLLALVPVAKKEKLEEVRQGVTALDTLMRSVGMDVRSVVKLENSFVCLGARVSPFSPGTSLPCGASLPTRCRLPDQIHQEKLATAGLRRRGGARPQTLGSAKSERSSIHSSQRG